jgi:hypothetical protein
VIRAVSAKCPQRNAIAVDSALVDELDRPRFLGKHLGYVATSAIAIDNLECVDEAEQRRQTQLANRRDRLRLRRDWQETHRKIDPALNEFAAVARTVPKIHRELGHVHRAIRRLDRELEEH